MYTGAHVKFFCRNFSQRVGRGSKPVRHYCGCTAVQIHVILCGLKYISYRLTSRLSRCFICSIATFSRPLHLYMAPLAPVHPSVCPSVRPFVGCKLHLMRLIFFSELTTATRFASELSGNGKIKKLLHLPKAASLLSPCD